MSGHKGFRLPREWKRHMRVMRMVTIGAIGYGAYRAWKAYSSRESLTNEPPRGAI